MLRIQVRHKGGLKAFGKLRHSQASKAHPTPPAAAFIELTGPSSPQSVEYQPPAAAFIEPAEGPWLEWRRLRPPFYLYVLALYLLDLSPRPDIITTGRIRGLLRLNKKNWHGLEYVIKNAVKWGMLTPYERKGKVIKGLYKINWEAVRYVASLIPMNPGEARLSRLNKASEKLSFGPFRVALEVIREFNALWGGTSLFASLFWAGAEGITHGRKPCNTRTPCVTPPSTHHLRRTLLKVGPHLLPAYVLGSRAEVYLVTAGVGGGAKSTFACLVYPDGKRLCGTPKLIQELLNSTGGVVPYPTPYGGYGLRPVVDYPPRGLLDFSTAPDHAKRYEPGLQLYGTSLLSCLSRFHVEVTTYKDLPEGFRGQASLVFKPSEAYASELSAHPDSLVPDVLHCLDALRGARDLLMHSLDTLAPDATLPRALELARLLPPPKYAEDPPLDIYVLYTPRNREGSRWRKGERHVATLDRFISELRDRLTQKAVLHGGKEVRQVKARDIEVIIPLPDTPQLRQLLALGYIYIYSNPRKDPEGAARFEFRPYSGVTDNYDKRALLSALVGVVALLGQPLEEARRALSQ